MNEKLEIMNLLSALCPLLSALCPLPFASVHMASIEIFISFNALF